MRIALNGFGRIGKNFLRSVLSDKKALSILQVVVINVGKGDPEAAALAFKYDSLMGTYPGAVSYSQGKLHIDDVSIAVVRELDPSKAPWKNYSIDWVVEASGHFTSREGASKHIESDAHNVLITAPAKDEDITIIPGVNLSAYKKESHKIVSLGSCTSNALFLMLKVLNDSFGIIQASMTTVHAYTNTQPLLDVDSSISDLRRGRAAALNIVPTTTGAMDVVGRLMPELSGKIFGCSLRVPVAKVSLIDCTAFLGTSLTKESVNKAFLDASKTVMKGLIEYTDLPLVSSDYSGNGHSVVIDSLMTQAQGNFAKVFGWYDNEWGYSERVKDFLLFVARG
ncbi:type I glyceraldehyde-3-phosphate dehydrogenase [Candidatus Dependentiae bacterium]|nr:type I glyceraldehyde-3-phosphate dehydrogenase [Candidatus Dependentiae bacterium]